MTKIGIFNANLQNGKDGKILMERSVLKGEPSNFLKMESIISPDFQKGQIVIFTLKIILQSVLRK